LVRYGNSLLQKGLKPVIFDFSWLILGIVQTSESPSVRGVVLMVRLFGHHVALPVALLVLCELCLFILSVAVALWIYPIFARTHFNLELIGRSFIIGLAAINLACLFAAGLYTRDTINIGSRLSRHLATATSLIVIAFGAYLLPFSWVYGYRFSNLYALALLAVCFQLILLFFVRAFFVNIFDIVGFKRRVLLLGEGSLAAKVQAWLDENDRGYTEVLRYDSARQERIVPLRGHLVRSAALTAATDPLLPTVLPEFVRQHSVDQIVVVTAETRGESVWDLLECRTSGVKVIDSLTFWERETGRIDLDAIEPSWLVYSGGFRSSLLRRAVQRSLDMVISFVGLVVMSPLMLIVALLIKLDSPGPILYRQERIGKDDQPFQILKFRSMRVDAEQDRTPRWAESGDPRVTRIGSVLRPTRLDELPQLLNVVRGEMSLVGPRPERPTFVSAFERQIPYYELRHSVRPGITGWAQINYKYTASLQDAKRKLEYDLFYIKNHSVFLDLAIMLQTLRIILWQQGAR
jgi:sugar transferase (PEP-CTERM system associated)